MSDRQIGRILMVGLVSVVLGLAIALPSRGNDSYPPAVERWYEEVDARWGLWGGEAVSEAMDILECESRGNPNVVYDWTTSDPESFQSVGLFQIAWENIAYTYVYPEGILETLDLEGERLNRSEALEILFDPYQNIEVAYQTWRLRGRSWSGVGGWGCARLV